MKPKGLMFAVAAILLFAVAGCSGKNETHAEKKTEAEPEGEQEKLAKHEEKKKDAKGHTGGQFLYLALEAQYVPPPIPQYPGPR
jgi:hypothetical protein